MNIVFCLGNNLGMLKNYNFYNLSDDQLVRTVSQMAKESRGTATQLFFRDPTLYHRIKTVFLDVKRRKNSGKNIINAEAWLLDNFYLVKRMLHKSIKERLPAIGKEPRIVAIARCIVGNSLKNITLERVITALKGVESVVNLTIRELKSFNAALSYALVESVYVLCERIAYLRRMERDASLMHVVSANLKSDAYIHYAYRNPQLKSELLSRTSQLGIDIDSVLEGYVSSISLTDQIAESTFDAMQKIGEITPLSSLIEVLSSTRILSNSVEYDNNSIDTKLYYLSKIEELARRAHTTEKDVASKLIGFSNIYQLDIADVIFNYKASFLNYLLLKPTDNKISRDSRMYREYAYALLPTILAIIISAVLGVFLLGYFAILTVLPIIYLIDAVFLKISPLLIKDTFVPRCNYQSIPDHAKTMIVVPEYVSSVEMLNSAIMHAKRLAINVGTVNARVALLIDFRESKEECSPIDKQLLSIINDYAEQDVDFFVRSKTLSQGMYSARDRKRGAIEDFNTMLVTGDTAKFSLVKRQPFTPKYIYLLDHDNVIDPNGVLDLINVMLHPFAKHYDIVVPHAVGNLNTAKTPYSKAECRHSGHELYPMYSSLYFDLFSKDIYCGKGLYRVNSYEKRLCGALPSDKLLSHDLIEGSILNCMPGGTIYEDAPESFSASEKRKARWLKGDIQVLPIALTSHDAISPFYATIMLKNALMPIYELMLLAMLLVGLFASLPLLYVALGVAFLPFILDVVIELRAFFDAKRLRCALMDICHSFCLHFRAILTLPYRAIQDCTILLSTLKDIITNTNLTRWVTFAEVKSNDNYNIFIPSMLLCVGVLIGLYFINIAVFITFACYFLLVMLEYVRLIASSIAPIPAKLKDRDVALLTDLAKRTYGYFDLVIRDARLTPDNYQFDPQIGSANYTSPTDLGFSLLAQVSALALGIITKEECFAKIEKLLCAIEKLPKYKGNLYNWYTTQGKILDYFVSSVDSGNFLACLIVVKECAKEYHQAEVCGRATKLIEGTQLEPLYDKNKKLFYLGYNARRKKHIGHYDLLASESRLLSYIFSAYYNNADNWNSLAREYTSSHGNTLLSWSGTMFEYLLPAIFITPASGTLLYDTERNAIAIQAHSKTKGLWGVSECGKHQFDEQGRYQYYAYGVSDLSLKSDSNHAVIAPYASVLALNRDSRAIANIASLYKRKLINKTGLFESVDYAKPSQIIYSQMTHHQGMIIASICNAIGDNYISRLFMRDAKINAIDTLLTEKSSHARYGQKTPKNPIKYNIINTDYFENTAKIEYLQRVFSSTNGDVSITIDQYGNNQVLYKNNVLSQEPSSYRCTQGGVFFVKRNSEIFSPTKSPRYCKKNYSVTIADGGVIHSNNSDGCALFTKKCDAFCARYSALTVDGNARQPVEVSFFEKVTLRDPLAYASHTVYSNMLVNTEFLPDYSAMLFTRLDPQNKAHLYCAYVVKGLDSLQLTTNREKVLGRYTSPSQCDFFRDDIDFSQATGAVLNPCMYFRGVPKMDNANKGLVEVITLFSYDKAKLLENVAKVYATDEKFYRYCYDVDIVDSSFTAGFLAYFANYSYNNHKNSTILYSDLVDKYRQLTMGRLSVLYTPHNNIAKLRELIKTAVVAQKFGHNINLIVYLTDDCSLSYDSLARCFEGYSIPYKIVNTNEYSIEELRLFCVLELDEDLSIPLGLVDKKNKYLDKIIEKSHVISKYDGDTVVGHGVFREDGDYVVTEPTELPYSNVIAMQHGGFVATENGGGYTYFGNSRENKCTEFYSEYLEDYPSERLLFSINNTKYRINKGGVNGGYTRYRRGAIEYYNQFDTFSSLVKQYMIDDGAVKVVSVDLECDKQGRLTYTIKPSLAWLPNKSHLAVRSSGDTMVITNLMTARSMYVRVLTTTPCQVKCNADIDNLSISVEVIEQSSTVYFLISAEENAILSMTYNDVIPKYHEALEYFGNLNNVKITTKDKALDLLFNKYLAYQTVSSRINAKMAYYQVGGATGFRDQLQDAIALRYAHPDLLKKQIIACATHQYQEGDIQHWWHEPFFGIRTTISDDKLFLPYAVAEYIEATGDVSILKEEYSYLVSKPLGYREHSRVEIPTVSTEKITIQEHCYRAIKSALRLGEHGLVLMGNGDWNDGLDDVGKSLKGESVVSTLILIIAIEKFKNYADDKARLSLYSIQNQLKQAVNKYAYNGTQYARLFRDNGSREGCPGDKAIEIDIVAQSLAVLAEVGTEEQAKSAIGACNRLIDYDNKLIKLLYPCQTPKDYLGYISTYPQGVRENGGQYTHAAIWYAWALIKLGKYDMAYEIARFFNPITRYQTDGIRDKYLGEPYVMSSDIYIGEHAGRMGWSWYTGSAGWYYRLILEGFFGVKRLGQYLSINPRLPRALDGSIIEYKHGNSTYTIKCINSGAKRIAYDGITLTDTNKIPLIEGKNITILVEF